MPQRLNRVVLLACTVVLASILHPAAAKGDPIDSEITAYDGNIHINELQMLGTHNSFKKFPKDELYVCNLATRAFTAILNIPPDMPHWNTGFAKAVLKVRILHGVKCS